MLVILLLNIYLDPLFLKALVLRITYIVCISNVVIFGLIIHFET